MGLRKSQEKSHEQPTTESVSTDTTELGSEHEAEHTRDAVPETPEEWKPQKSELYILLTLSLISLVVALDASIIGTSLATIVRDLDGNATDAFWVGTSYLLTHAVVQPFLAALSDIFGRSIILLGSLIFFTAGTIVCCVSQSLGVLIAGRCIQGVGGGGIIALSLVIMTDIVPLRQRPRFYGIIQGAWALGTVIGPLIGGLFAQHSTWRWVFYINFPFCGMGLILVPLTVRLSIKKTSFASKIARVDWLGGLLFIGGLTSFLIAISWGGSQHPWGSAATLVPLIVGIAAVAASFVWEGFAREPFLRRSLFRSYSAIAAYVSAAFQGLLLYAGLYYMPLWFQAVKGASPTRAGVDMFPIVVSLVPASIITGGIITKRGRYKYILIGALALDVLANGVIIMWGASTNTATWVIQMIIVGIAQGIVLNGLNFSTQATAETKDVAYSAAMYTFTRSLGMSIGVAIGGTVWQNLMSKKLRDHGLPEFYAKNAEGFIETLHRMPNNQVKRNIIDSYVYAYKGVFIVLTSIIGAAFVLNLFIKEYSLDQILDSQHKLKRSKKEKHRSTDEEEMRPKELPKSEDGERVTTPETAHTAQ
ncbi:MAG: hypothetical protein Q9227_004892 [Pyrenula ochraceoflavens]